MAIFTAGCIETTNDRNKIRKQVYTLAKKDLDSSAMKISVRKSPTCINFIAFLPKDKIVVENILKTVSKCEEKTVVMFELDYKYVGVLCEEQRIVDYILDKPEQFAEERGYETRFADNAGGVKLVSFNLDRNSRETRAGFMSLTYTIILTSVMFYSGYYYMQDISINKTDSKSLEMQYKTIVKKEFDRSKKIVSKIEMVNTLEDIERLTKATNSTIRQVTYDEKNFCVEVNTLQMEPFIAMLPKKCEIKYRNKAKGIVQYCYEKI